MYVRRCALLVALLFAGLGVRAQQPLAELLALDPAAFHQDRVCVKLAEGTDAEWREGQLVSRSGRDLTAIARWFRLARPEALVGSVPRATLDAWHAHAVATTPPERRPGHLGLWFRLRTDGRAASEALIAALRQEPLVEHVHAEARLFPAAANLARPDDIAPPTPSFTALQHAHEPTPIGHGSRLVAGLLGARGDGIGLRMVERTFVVGHEDIGQLVPANFFGAVPAYDPIESQHGLSGCSIVCADRNGYGITGIADGVTARFLGMDVNGGFESSLALALANSQPGDVVLVVLMMLLPALGPGTWLPVEFLQSAFDAVATVTANDRHVVMPAGNGNRSLDDPALLGRFDRSVRDSGAILVAASFGGQLLRAPYSNWGARVDANGWGDQVVSCGYGDLFFPNADLLQSYTQLATGTSSATPHVAGVVAAIQGACKWQLGHVLTNAQVLTLLHTYGPGTPDVIGRRPDLVAILQSLGVFDGLTVAAAETTLTGPIQVQMTAPAGTLVVLAGALATGSTPFGWNRPLHLDPGGAVVLDVNVPNGGTTTWNAVVPNDVALHGVDLFFQALRWPAGGAPSLTNSCQVSIL